MPDLPTNLARSSSFYVTSGTLPLDSQSYVARQADEDLLGALLAGEYCFVLNSRQMGKSSLCVRTMAKLQEAGVKTVFLDLTKIGGSNVTPEQWYIGLLSETGRALGLRKEFLDYWKQNSEYSLIQRYIGALHDVALTRTSSPLVLFIDEIDAVKSLSFSTDEFFAAIRECYNRRVHEPEYRRLAFALVGSATPSDLIQDTRTSPFNIGRQIELKDFTLEEMLHLAEGFIGPVSPTGTIADRVLERVFYWTNGHPYLTQILCKAISEALNASTPTLGDQPPKSPKIGGFRGPIPLPTQRPTPKLVDCLVSTMFFEAKARERNVNLADVSNRILSSYINADRREENRAAILDLYRQVWGRRKRVVDDETNPLITRLKLSGITTGVQGELRVRNRIYERVFDKAWIDQNMPDAELRRQKAAYRQGLYRAATIASVVLLAMVGLTAWAFQQRNKAIVARRDADAKTIEVRRRGYDAYAASMVTAMTAWDFGNITATRKALQANRDQQRRGFEYGYLTRLCHLDRRTIQGHTDAVISVMFLKGGKRLLSASHDGTVRLWDAGTGSLLRTNQIFSSKIETIACSPDEHAIAVAGHGHIKIWDIDAGKEVFDLSDNQNDARDIEFTNDGALLAASERGGAIAVWDTRTWKQRRVFGKTHFNDVSSLAISPNGKTLATAYIWASTAILWDIATGKQIRELSSDTDAITSVAFSPDGSRLATGSRDGTAKLWNVATGGCVRTLAENKGSLIFKVAFSPDGVSLATAKSDGKTCLWDTRSGKKVAELKGHEAGVYTVAFSNNGAQIATAGEDSTIKLWDVAGPQETVTLSGHAGPVKEAVISPDGAMAATAGSDGTVRLWDVLTGKQVRAFRGPPTFQFWTVAFSPDGQRLIVSGSADMPMTWVWSVRTGQKLIEIKDCMGSELSRDGKLLATFSAAATAEQIIDAKTGRFLFSLPSNSTQVAFYSDGKRLITHGLIGSETPKVYDLASGKSTLSLRGHTSSINWVACSPNGKFLATASDDKTAKLWDAKTGKELFTLRAHLAEVNCVAFSPDSTQLITCGAEGAVVLWDVETGNQLLALNTGRNVPQAAFSADGKRIVAAIIDGTARIWQRYTGEEITGVIASEATAANRLAQVRAASDQNRQAQANARFALVRARVSHKDAMADGKSIDMSNYYDAQLNRDWENLVDFKNDLASLPKGTQTFKGTRFDIRGVIQVDGVALHMNGLYYPQFVNGIPIRQKCRRLCLLIGTIWPEDDDVTIGKFKLHYQNTSSRDFPILYGRDVRDWWLRPGERTDGGTVVWNGTNMNNSVIGVPDSTGGVVWTGTTKAMSKLRLYKMVIENPLPNVQIDSLDFVSTMSNSSPFLIAITAE